MQKKLLALTISTLALSGQALAAPGDPVPNSFTNGTVADADQVNANFAEVVSQITTVNSSIPAAETTYDYNDFTSLYNQKVFSFTDSHGPVDTETRNYDRSVTNQLSFQRLRSSSSILLRRDDIFLDTSGDELRFIRRDLYNVTGGVATGLNYTETLSPGLFNRTTSMLLGRTVGTSSDITLSNGATGSSITTQTASLIAVNQSVTVPAGTFTGCMVIAHTREGINAGGSYKRMNTYCPTAGLVKQIQTRHIYDQTATASVNANVSTRTQVLELSSCTNSSDQNVNCVTGL